jgi:hypothetical protein
MKARQAKQKARKGRQLKQIAALPFRRDEAGDVHFLLITSRGTQRFVIPKGWRMRKRSDAEAASVEAMEEAGVAGAVSKKPVGSYFYWKRVKKAFLPVSVDVYPLEVSEERRDWPERSQRKRAWVSVHHAIALIDEPQLILLMREAAALLERPRAGAGP